MSSNVMYAPVRVWEGLLNESPRFEAYFYHHIRPKAEALIRRCYGSDPVDWLEDCFSKAFLVLLDKIRSGAYEHRNLDAFALQIVKFTYRNARRKRLSLVPFTDEVPDSLIAKPLFNTAGELFEQLQQRKLSRWYKRLPLLKQRMLDLRMQGLDYKEIAEELDFSHGAIRNKFARLFHEAREV